MNLWLAQHGQALKLVLSRFGRSKLNTLLISLAIGITLALPLILYVVLHQLTAVVSDIKQDSHISIFLKADYNESQMQAIQQSLSNNVAVKHFRFVPKQEALTQLSAASDAPEVIASLSENPLPDAFFVEPAQLDAAAIDALKSQLSEMAGVDQVQIDGAWLNRLNYLLAIGRQAMLLLTGLLGVALFAVIGNTIRMQILTQQEEIEVSQLIGATKGFIRRPFLYAGALYGFMGSVLAVSICALVIMSFNQSLAALAAAYQTQFSLALPTAQVALCTALIAIAIGLISAYLAVAKSLQQK